SLHHRARAAPHVVSRPSRRAAHPRKTRAACATAAPPPAVFARTRQTSRPGAVLIPAAGENPAEGFAANAPAQTQHPGGTVAPRCCQPEQDTLANCSRGEVLMQARAAHASMRR